MSISCISTFDIYQESECEVNTHLLNELYRSAQRYEPLKKMDRAISCPIWTASYSSFSVTFHIIALLFLFNYIISEWSKEHVLRVIFFFSGPACNCSSLWLQSLFLFTYSKKNLKNASTVCINLFELWQLQVKLEKKKKSWLKKPWPESLKSI